MKTPTGYVALRKGRHVRNCIFLNWLDAEIHITNFDQAEYTVLDTLQDAEKYIIINDNYNKKCSQLEEFAVVATSHHDQYTRTNDNTKTTRTTATAPSTTTTATTTTTTTRPQLQPATSIDNTDITTVQKQNKSVVNPSSSSSTDDDDDDDDDDDSPKNNNKITTTPIVVRHRINTYNNNNNNTYNIASKKLNKTPPTYTAKKIGNKWKTSYEKLLTYRNNDDGTFPKVIPDYDIRSWLYVQKSEYKKRLLNLPTSLHDGKLELLRNVGISFIIEQEEEKQNEQDNNNSNSKTNNNTNTRTSTPPPLPPATIDDDDNNNNNIDNASSCNNNDNTNKSTKDISHSTTPNNDDDDKEKKKKKCNNNSLKRTIGYKWKICYDRIAKLRKLDGTYPEPIPDIDLRNWLYTQKGEYKKLCNGYKSTIFHEKIHLLRNIGITFNIHDKTSTIANNKPKIISSITNNNNNNNNSFEKNTTTTITVLPSTTPLPLPTKTTNNIASTNTTITTKNQNKIDITETPIIPTVEPGVNASAEEEMKTGCQDENDDNNNNNTTNVNVEENNNNDDDNKKIGKIWKSFYNKLASYRNNVDGTYPRPIPDYDVRTWLYKQKCDYRKKIQGISNNKLTNEKEQLLRDIGIVFTTERIPGNALPYAAPTTPPSPPPATTIDNNNNNDDTTPSSQDQQLKEMTNQSVSTDQRMLLKENSSVVASVTMTATPCRPLEPSVHQNENNNNKNISTLSTTHATSESPTHAAAAATAKNTNTSLVTMTNNTTVVWCQSKSVGKKWKAYFEKLTTYRKSDGTFPKPIPDDDVRKWLYHQKYEYRKKIQGLSHSLPDEKEDLLRSIGVVFTLGPRISEEFIQNDSLTKKHSKTNNVAFIQQVWKDNLDKLKQYMDSHDGSWDVKKEHDQYLRSWILHQKAQYLRLKEGKDSSITELKLSMLRDIGVDLDKNVYTWNDRIEQLKKFRDENGHLEIPCEHPVLGEWVKSMIRQYQKMRSGLPVRLLDSKKISDLRKAGVDFFNEVDIQPKKIQKWNEEFETMFEQLKEYKEKYGSCIIKKTHQEYYNLMLWCYKVQTEYRKLSDNEAADKSRLSIQQMARLTELGFKFTLRVKLKSFEERIEQLKEFQRNGGDINQITNKHPDFGEFLSRQRRDYRCWVKGEYTRINEERIKALESLGFQWNVENWVDPADQGEKKTWEERFQQLMEYK